MVGKVQALDFLDNCSTTAIVEKIRQQEAEAVLVGCRRAAVRCGPFIKGMLDD